MKLFIKMAQPNVDTKYLNEVFNIHERKLLDAFSKHRVFNAVRAYRKQDEIGGIISLGLYYTYINENQEAIALMNESIQKYGYKIEFIDVLAKAYQFLGDYEKQLETYLLFIESTFKEEFKSDKDLSDVEKYIKNIIHVTDLFLLKEYSYLLEFFDEEERENLVNLIEKKISQLEKIGVSVATYRKLATLTAQVVYKHYYKGVRANLEVEPEFGFAQLKISFNRISVQEAVEINNEINEAVLEAGLKDEVFANEVVYITTDCTLAYKEQEEEEFA